MITELFVVQLCKVIMADMAYLYFNSNIKINTKKYQSNCAITFTYWTYFFIFSDGIRLQQVFRSNFFPSHNNISLGSYILCLINIPITPFAMYAVFIAKSHYLHTFQLYNFSVLKGVLSYNFNIILIFLGFNISFNTI